MTKDNNRLKPDYEVGYGKPPKSTRFKPGQSGNPKGRKRKPKSVVDQLRAVLSHKIPITEGDRTKRIPVMEVILRNTANKAAKGDLRAVSFVINLLNSAPAAGSETLDTAALSEEDQALFEQAMGELGFGMEMHTEPDETSDPSAAPGAEESGRSAAPKQVPERQGREDPDSDA